MSTMQNWKIEKNYRIWDVCNLTYEMPKQFASIHELYSDLVPLNCGVAQGPAPFLF